MCSTIPINEFISANYNKIKTTLKKEWHKLETEAFDEDVFHDTLIKCMEQLKDKELPSSEIISYIVAAFKTNTIREKSYAFNKYKADDEIDTIRIETTPRNDIDFNFILSEVCQKFGKSDYEVFLDWLDGMTIKELNEKYNKTNLRYVIERIKKYIKEFCQNEKWR